MTEEEYGGGAELPTTSFLVLSLLTFWFYTVWKYDDLLRRDLAGRLRHFRAQRNPPPRPEDWSGRGRGWGPGHGGC